MSDIINKWSVLRDINQDNVSSIKTVYIFGSNGKQVIITTNGDNVYAFGDNNNYGCLGLGHTNPIRKPTKIEELCGKQVIHIEFGIIYNFVIARTHCGDVYSWGCNDSGELGIGNTTSQYKPTIISALSDKNVIDIKSSSFNSLALTECGDVYVWGDITRTTPTKLNYNATRKKITSISCGWNHVLALTNTGKVYCWGENNNFGQFGNGNSVNSYFNKWCVSQYASTLCVVKLACGPYHSIILTREGIVYCFGDNQFGQCGDGIGGNKNIPTKVNIKAKIVDIAATKHYDISVGLSANGCCYIWGKCGKEAVYNPFQIPTNNMIQVIQHYSIRRVTCAPLVLNNDNKSSIMDRISNKFNKREYSDIAFKVEDKYIYAQKAYLTLVCKHFEAMFLDNKWLESNKSEIEIKIYSYTVYYAFIKYLYTDCVDIRKDDDAMQLLDLANCYLDETLKQRCVDIIKNMVKNENVFAIYCTAAKYNMNDLRSHCIEFVQNNFANKTSIEAIMDNAVKFTEK